MKPRLALSLKSMLINEFVQINLWFKRARFIERISRVPLSEIPIAILIECVSCCIRMHKNSREKLLI